MSDDADELFALHCACVRRARKLSGEAPSPTDSPEYEQGFRAAVELMLTRQNTASDERATTRNAGRRKGSRPDAESWRDLFDEFSGGLWPSLNAAAADLAERYALPPARVRRRLQGLAMGSRRLADEDLV